MNLTLKNCFASAGILFCLIGVTGLCSKLIADNPIIFLKECEDYSILDNDRQVTCKVPPLSCDDTQVVCVIDQTPFVPKSRDTFELSPYSKCSDNSATTDCEVLEDQDSVSCMDWSNYNDVGCNNYLCPGSHMLKSCIVYVEPGPIDP